MWTRSLCALGFALLTAGPAGARASPAASPPGAFLSRLEGSLGGHLTRAEEKRLLADPRVRRQLAWLAEGYDGKHDSIQVRRVGERLVVRVRTTGRRMVCDRVAASPERADPPLECEDIIETEDDRRLTVDAALWRVPAPRRAPAAPPAVEPPETVAPSVLRHHALLHPERDGGAHTIDPELAVVLREHAEFRETVVRGHHWTDPFLGQTLSEEVPELWASRQAPRDKAPPTDPAKSVLNDRVIHVQNLPMPFQIGPGDLVPTPPYIPNVPIDIDPPDARCLAAWDEREAATHPPALACFESVIRRGRLEASDAYRLDQALGGVLRWWPGWNAILKLVSAEAGRERVSTPLWALTWLEWGRTHRSAVGTAISKLTPRERRTLRRRLWPWWTSPAYAAYGPLITEIYESHLVALYPELRTAGRPPDPSRVSDGYLWATNWLASQRDAIPERVRERFGKLDRSAQRLVQAVMQHPAHRKRYPGPVAALSPGV
jgi:hypothetical protein